jgi:hypothetical protein
MRKSAIFLLLLFPFMLLAGCSAKREVKTAVCYAKMQPGENKCLEKLAIDTKDTLPCDKIKLLKTLNGSISFPNKVSCYAEVAFRTGEIGICNGLGLDSEKTECKYRFELYLETDQVRVD